MPKYKVLCKIGNSKRREWYDTYTAKTPEEAIKKAKAHDKKLHTSAKKKGMRGKNALPKSSDWKAVRK